MKSAIARTEELQRQNLRSQLFAVTLPIFADRRNSPNRRHRSARILRDRVLIFQLGSDGSGKVVQEAVVPWPVILGQSHTDPCFQQGAVSPGTD